MIRRMQWRFIGAAMAAIAAVMAVLLLGINIWNYRSVTGQQDNMLQQIRTAEQNGQPLPGDGSPAGTPAVSGTDGQDAQEQNAQERDAKGQNAQGQSRSEGNFQGGRDQFSPEVQYMLRFFSVCYDENGTVTQVNNTFIASIDEKEAVQYADRVRAKGKTRGYYDGYRYLVTAMEPSKGEDSETMVILLNSEKELHSISSILLITSAIALACMLVVFVLVVLLSKRAILPYLRNIETQKQFITNAGHELKTPLTAISTSADVLAMEYEEDEWVQNIRQQSARMTKLIAALVTLSRLDEENPFPERQEFSLSDAVWEASESFVSLARARGKDFIREIADGVQVTGDAVAIQQMISILLDNAFKYSSPGGSIALCLTQKGKRAELAVSNTCSPEDKPEMSRLFDRFYRGDGAHSDKVGGTGIGLSIAKATAEAHGGSIQAAWDPQGVITFRVLL